MREFVVRLMYCEMLGHDVSWGYIHAINMTQVLTSHCCCWPVAATSARSRPAVVWCVAIETAGQVGRLHCRGLVPAPRPRTADPPHQLSTQGMSQTHPHTQAHQGFCVVSCSTCTHPHQQWHAGPGQHESVARVRCPHGAVAPHQRGDHSRCPSPRHRAAPARKVIDLSPDPPPINWPPFTDELMRTLTLLPLW